MYAPGKYRVVQLGPEPGYSENRWVDVPGDCDDLEDLLEMVFYYGQNDVQNVPGKRSVSVGDFVEVNGELYCCESNGWYNVATGSYVLESLGS